MKLKNGLFSLALFILPTNARAQTGLAPGPNYGVPPPTPAAIAPSPLYSTNKARPGSNTAPVTVSGTNLYSVSVSRTNVIIGGTLSVSWVNPDFPGAINLFDWVGLSRVDVTPPRLVETKFITGRRGSTVFIADTAGVYEALYLKFGVVPVARSERFTVRELSAVPPPNTLLAEPAGNSIVVSWFAETNRTYILLANTNLSGTNWLNQAEIRGRGTVTNFLLLKSGEHTFYRLSVR